MGLEFSSANLNNQMWEQKKKRERERAPPPPPPSPTRLYHPTTNHNSIARAWTPPPPSLPPSPSPPNLRPHLCSLLPGPHIRGAQCVQPLIRISLRGRQGKEGETRGFGGSMRRGRRPRRRRGFREGGEGLVYLIRQNCRLLITTPFSQQASQPHPASVNMEHRASQSPQHSLSSNGRIKTV